jgi:hypothetical protein
MCNKLVQITTTNTVIVAIIVNFGGFSVVMPFLWKKSKAKPVSKTTPNKEYKSGLKGLQGSFIPCGYDSKHQMTFT